MILDEPTNHLDILSKNVLKEALINYEGTFIVVSHDRDFLDGLTNRIWDIADHKIRIHHFSLSEYLKFIEPKTTSKDDLTTKKSKIKNKQTTSNKEIHTLEKEIKKIEIKISKRENEIKSLEQQMANPNSISHEELQAFYSKIELMNSELEELMKDWEEKSLELENMKS